MQLEFDVLELTTTHAFNIARQPAPGRRRNVWVRLRDGAGIEGWGEAPATAFYGETADSVTAALPLLAGALDEAGDEEIAPERVERAAAGILGRNPAARAALSAALHDLLGKRLGAPVWRMWGLHPEDAPRSSFTLGIDTPEVLREKLRQAASYPILKVKTGTPRDEELLRIVREEAPEKALRVDANTAFTAVEAIRSLPMLEAYGVELLEQPLARGDLEGMRRLRRHARIPLIADESCEIAADVPRLAAGFDGVNVKLAKCGSLREALRIVHVARAHGMRVMLGCMIESTLGIAAALQLAPLVDDADLDGAALLAGDPFVGPGLEPDGRLRFNVEPGLGVLRRDAT